MKIIVSEICRQGLREENQDTALKFLGSHGACLVVCDGLGSYDGSGKISRICAEKFIEAYKELAQNKTIKLFTASAARHCTQAAVRGVLYEKRKDGGLSGSTTLAAIITDGRSAVFCHAGDTRIYRITHGRITYVTKDHSLAQQAVDELKISRYGIADHPDQNKLTKTVGGEREVEPDITVFTDISKADRFFICTDGLWTSISEREMEDIISTYDSPAAALKRFEKYILKQMTPDHDNFTAILCGFIE